MQQPDLLEVFLHSLEMHGISYYVTGSVAAVFYGEPRLTHDIDLVLNLEGTSILQFISLYPIEEFYCPPEEVIQVEMSRKPFGHFNLIHHKTGLKADIYTSSSDKLHEWAFQNRKRIRFNDRFSFWIAPPEYVILRKLEYFRDGGSDKHLEDIRKMIPLLGETLDLKFLSREIAKRSLNNSAKKITGLLGANDR